MFLLLMTSGIYRTINNGNDVASFPLCWELLNFTLLMKIYNCNTVEETRKCDKEQIVLVFEECELKHSPAWTILWLSASACSGPVPHCSSLSIAPLPTRPLTASLEATRLARLLGFDVRGRLSLISSASAAVRASEPGCVLKWKLHWPTCDFNGSTSFL